MHEQAWTCEVTARLGRLAKERRDNFLCARPVRASQGPYRAQRVQAQQDMALLGFKYAGNGPFRPSGPNVLKAYYENADAPKLARTTRNGSGYKKGRKSLDFTIFGPLRKSANFLFMEVAGVEPASKV